MKKYIIGILVSGIMDEATKEICMGVKQAAYGQNVDVVVIPGKYWGRDLSGNFELMYEYQYNTIFSFARPDTVDGLVIAADCIGCLTTKEQIDLFLQDYAGIPSVLVASKRDGYVGVTFQNAKGIEEGMDYLINKVGHKKFAMLGGSSDISDALERKEAFIHNLSKNGIPFSEEMFVEGNLSRYCQDKAAELLDSNPGLEAIICVNDETAMGVYEELKRRNLKPGKDISVMGYDDSKVAINANPSMSSVRADMSELGAESFRMIMQMIKGEKIESRTMPTKFVLRNSTISADVLEEEKNHIMEQDVAFHDLFYRYQNEAEAEEVQGVKDAFLGLLDKLYDTFEKDVVLPEKCKELQEQADVFFNYGILAYSDVEELLVYFEEIYRYLKRKQTSENGKFVLRDFFSGLYRKIILSMNTLAGSEREAERESNFSMKLFVRDMLQFEKGNDKSYAALLSNLDWLQIKNAYLYTFAKPITHLDKEPFTAPDRVYLKAFLQNGKVTSVPITEQKIRIKDIFHNRFMEYEEKYNLVLLPLFSNENLYGVVLCDLTDGIYSNGEFVVNQFGSAAKVISLLRMNEKIQQQLEDNLVTMRENNIALDMLSKSDGLTGILNRRGFLDEAGKLIEKSKKESQTLLVGYVDMNNLKIINDRYGHEEGDFSLKLIGDMLVKAVQDKGVAGRIGGDEFAFVLEFAKDDKSEAILQAIYSAFDTFNAQSEKAYNVTVSAGAHILQPEDTLTLTEALTMADEKLYEVKQLRKKTVAKKKA